MTPMHLFQKLTFWQYNFQDHNFYNANKVFHENVTNKSNELKIGHKKDHLMRNAHL